MVSKSPFSTSFARNSSKVNTFLAIFSAELLSSARRIYSSLNVKIAEGSIPIKGVSSVIISLKTATFKLQTTFASFKKPLDIKLLPDSS